LTNQLTRVRNSFEFCKNDKMTAKRDKDYTKNKSTAGKNSFDFLMCFKTQNK